MIQTISLFASIIAWFMTFIDFYEVSSRVFLYIAIVLTLWFLFEMISQRSENKQKTMTFAAMAIFFLLSFSVWLKGTWKTSDGLQGFFKIDADTAENLTMLIGTFIALYMTFVFHKWTVSFFGRGNIRMTKTEPSIVRFFRRISKQRDIKKNKVPSIVLGKIEKFEP